MRTKLVFIVIFGALAVSAASLAAAQDATPVAPTAAEGLRFDVVFDDTWLLADEEAGPQLGDRVILNDDLLINGEVVGHNGGFCTITDAEAPEALCLVTFWLPEGTISAQFLNSPPPAKVFAITGGTGAYREARGYGELVEHGDNTGSLELFISE